MRKHLRLITSFVALAIMATSMGACKKAEVKPIINDKATNVDAIDTSKLLELDMWVGGKGGGYYKGNVKEDIVKDYFTQKTGVKVANKVENGTMENIEKFNLLYAAGEMPALIRIGTGSEDAKIVDSLEKSDQLWKFTDEELKKYIPDIRKLVAPSAWEIYKRQDGKTAGILTRGYALSDEGSKMYPDFVKNSFGLNNNRNTFIVRDDILKTVFPNALSYDELMAKAVKNGKLDFSDFVIPGLDSWQEFQDFLYSVKGKFGDKVIPFGMKDKGSINSFFDAFYGMNLYIRFDAITLAPTSFPHTKKDDFSKMMKTFNKMYNDGLIDKEFAIHKADKYDEKMYQGKYALLMAVDPITVNTNIAKAGLNYKYRTIQISDKTANYMVDGYQMLEPARYSHSFYINKAKVKDQKDAFKILNYLNSFATKEGMSVVKWGPADKGFWKDNADGTRDWVDPLMKAVSDGKTAWSGGTAKDQEYYGISNGTAKYARDEFWWPTLGSLPPLASAKPVEEKSMRALWTEALNATTKGYYQDDHSAWNGTTATNNVFWAEWSNLNDALVKMIMVPPADFAREENGFFDVFNKKAEFSKYWDEQTKLMADYYKKNKDILLFHPKVDKSKIK